MNTTRTKCIHYAYPTSDTAKRFGKYATGCFYVAIGAWLPHSAMAAFDSWESAREFADTLPVPYNQYSMQDPNR